MNGGQAATMLRALARRIDEGEILDYTIDLANGIRETTFDDYASVPPWRTYDHTGRRSLTVRWQEATK